MRQDAVSIDRFYAAPIGQAAARMVGTKIYDIWGDCAELSLLGLGFAQPVLSPFGGHARRCIAATPRDCGRTLWHADGTARGNQTVSVDEYRLPFASGTFDRIILLHALEEAADPRALMREVWRVAAPEGRIIVAAANRRSLWAQAEATPFGHGRPWTRRQLVGFLSDGLFQVTASTYALHMPPLDWRLITSASDGWERIGHLLARGLGGVVLVEAVKRLYAETGSAAVAPVFVAKPARARPGTSLPLTPEPCED